MRRKGEYGYIHSRRIFGAVRSALGLCAVLGIYFAARSYFGTNRNVFTIIAVLLCLPVGMWIVNLIMFCKAKGCTPGAHSLIEIHDAAVPGAYDLYLTGYDKNFQISHAALGDGVICALTEDRGTDLEAGENYITKILQEDRRGSYKVTIYRNLEAYLKRLDELENMPQDRETGKAALRSLYSVAL